MIGIVLFTVLQIPIKLAEAMTLGSTEYVRLPRMPLVGAHRQQVEHTLQQVIDSRPALPA